MPLTRANVTKASRTMLPTYVFFFAGLGANYTATPARRLKASPALEYVSRFMPLPAWGALFLAAAALMVGALISQKRIVYRFALLLCAWSMAVWTVANLLAGFRSDATPLGWLWPAFVVAACIASYRSLTVREVD